MRSVKTAYSYVPCRHSYVEMHKRVYIYIYIYIHSRSCACIYTTYTPKPSMNANIKRTLNVKVQPSGVALKCHPRALQSLQVGPARHV